VDEKPTRWPTRAVDRLAGIVGGRARLRVVSLLAAILALNGADIGTISATADNLKHAFGIGNTGIGVLITVPSLVGAVCTLPLGVLADRVRRTRLMAISVLTWAIAMVASGAATSFSWMLLSRVALSAVTASAGPVIASLSGDFFPTRERAKLYGFVLAGEMIGTGVGFVVSGDLAVVAGWRSAFWWLAVPSVVLGWLLWRLPEPARGGQSRLMKGQDEIIDEVDVEEADPEQRRKDEERALRDARDGVAKKVIERADIQPDERLVLDSSPADCSLWWAVKYVLRVRTNVVIIVASALGYFYFAGLRGFALIFAQNHYGVPKAAANNVIVVIGLFAVIGVFSGGRIADSLLKRGVVSARVIVPAVVLLALPLLLVPAIVTSSIWIAMPLLAAGGILLGAANPPQDAARLDIIHPNLWGRSESVRTVLRTALEAAAPTLFGFTADHWFGGRQAGDSGLEYAFLLFLGAIVLAGITVLFALRTYPRDVATATASVERTMCDESQKRAQDTTGGGADDAASGAPASAAAGRFG
jgi:MFS family permease